MHAPPAAFADTYTITLDGAIVDAPVSGRLVLFFITQESPEWDGRDPIEGPFFEFPQPIVGIDVVDLAPGASVTIPGDASGFGGTLDSFDGYIRVQAVLDRDDTERSFAAPGNLRSDVAERYVAPDRDDRIMLRLREVIPDRGLPELPTLSNLHWVSSRSEMLSEFYSRDVMHRAGVALPKGYDEPENEGRRWPAIYVIPGFGGREESAVDYATMLREVEPQYIPQAVWIVLDPEAPLGHHGFCDSANNGPRGAAFVREFIPHLESQFRLDARPEARLLYGHSSGGWSVLWLQLNHSSTFGACWSSAPDPIDFSRFQNSNLYSDSSLYQFATGNETPSYRIVDFDGRDVVLMTVRQEMQMEHAIDPRGRSGEQWDAWEAMWSPRDEVTGAPMQLVDPVTGAIRQDVLASWREFDIYLLTTRNWEPLATVYRDKVRLFVGEHDNFYLDRAVRNLKEVVDARLAEFPHRKGYVEIIPFAGHGGVVSLTNQRMHDEMIAHIRSIDTDD